MLEMRKLLANFPMEVPQVKPEFLPYLWTYGGFSQGDGKWQTLRNKQ
jgi:hypothetical protein